MQKPAVYRTIAARSSGEYREKGSKFLAFVMPVSDEADIQAELDSLRSEYHDARHHCYAFILGFDGEQFRANDDGEPGHSAGDPILGQLRSRDLTNVLCVVVRYFGGTKLGVSGLINAYRTAAADALENGQVVAREIMTRVRLIYDYEATSEVMRMVDEFSLQVVNQEFTADCRMEARVNIRFEEALREKADLLQATGSGLRLEFIPDSPS